MVMKQYIPETLIDYDPYGGGFNFVPSLPSYTPPPRDTIIYNGEEMPNITTTGQQPKTTLPLDILDFKTRDLDKPGGLIDPKNISIPQMGEFKPATTLNKNKNQQLAFMLYALGGALRGDKNFVENTMRLKDAQDSKKREKEMRDNWENALNKIKKQGNINPTLLSLAEILDPVQGANLVAAGIPEKEKEKEDKTAAMINLEAYNKIKETGKPEEIAIAERVLIGTRQNKPIDQMKKELIANLLKQKDSIGDPLSEDEINNRLGLFDTLIGTQAPANNNTGSFQVGGYTVQEVK